MVMVVFIVFILTISNSNYETFSDDGVCQNDMGTSQDPICNQSQSECETCQGQWVPFADDGPIDNKSGVYYPDESCGDQDLGKCSKWYYDDRYRGISSEKCFDCQNKDTDICGTYYLNQSGELLATKNDVPGGETHYNGICIAPRFPKDGRKYIQTNLNPCSLKLGVCSVLPQHANVMPLS